MMLMRVLWMFLVYVLLLTLATPSPDFSVVGYLPEWRYEGANWEALAKYLTHLILFSLEVTPRGKIASLDRLPPPDLLKQAREQTQKHGTKLMVCFGGNGRSGGFPEMVASPQARRRFINAVVKLCNAHDLDGVDYNWEYPGYPYNANSQKDYDGLYSLVAETRAAFDSSGRVLSVAYYPDGRQEEFFARGQVFKYAHMLHAMTYDQPREHSTIGFATSAIRRSLSHVPATSLTLGLPFYSRHIVAGDWKSYEDLLLEHVQRTGKPPNPNTDLIENIHYFNGISTITAKVRLAKQLGLGGVMIWEVGQDCRLWQIVTPHNTTHAQTCITAPKPTTTEGEEKTRTNNQQQQQQQEQHDGINDNSKEGARQAHLTAEDVSLLVAIAREVWPTMFVAPATQTVQVATMAETEMGSGEAQQQRARHDDELRQNSDWVSLFCCFCGQCQQLLHSSVL